MDYDQMKKGLYENLIYTGAAKGMQPSDMLPLFSPVGRAFLAEMVKRFKAVSAGLADKMVTPMAPVTIPADYNPAKIKSSNIRLSSVFDERSFIIPGKPSRVDGLVLIGPLNLEFATIDMVGGLLVDQGFKPVAPWESLHICLQLELPADSVFFLDHTEDATEGITLALHPHEGEPTFMPWEGDLPILGTCYFIARKG